MRILYLSYENYIDLEKDHPIMYLNRNKMDEIGDDQWKYLVDQFQPELLLEREFNDGRAIYNDVIDYVKRNHSSCKTAVWLIDTHVSHTRHLEYAKHFEYIFMAISSFVEEFSKIYGNTFWLPVCWPYSADEISTNYRPINKQVVFVGNFERIKQWFPERAEYVQFLQNHYKNKFLAVTDYDNMRSIIKEAKVSFNYAVKDDMNFRVFETLGLGTELVTNDVPDLHKISGLTDFINIYRDKQDLVKLIDGILDNTSTTNMILAQQWVKEKHTLYHRYKSLLRMIVSGKQDRF